MNCTHFESLLAQDAPLDADAARHAAGCPDCHALSAALREVDAGLASLPALAPPAQVVARTVAAAGRPSRPSAAFPVALGAFALAAGLLVALVPMTLSDPTPQTAETQPQAQPSEPSDGVRVARVYRLGDAMTGGLREQDREKANGDGWADQGVYGVGQDAAQTGQGQKRQEVTANQPAKFRFEWHSDANAAGFKPADPTPSSTELDERAIASGEALDDRRDDGRGEDVDADGVPDGVDLALPEGQHRVVVAGQTKESPDLPETEDATVVRSGDAPDATRRTTSTTPTVPKVLARFDTAADAGPRHGQPYEVRLEKVTGEVDALKARVFESKATLALADDEVASPPPRNPVAGNTARGHLQRDGKPQEGERRLRNSREGTEETTGDGGDGGEGGQVDRSGRLRGPAGADDFQTAVAGGADKALEEVKDELTSGLRQGLVSALGKEGKAEEADKDGRDKGGKDLQDDKNVAAGQPEARDVSKVSLVTKPAVSTVTFAAPGYFALEQLVTIPPRGYFRNTYLPGDPRIAWLRRSLTSGLLVDGRRLALDAAAQPTAQPFDAPRGEALGLHVAADHTAVEGRTRVTLQVGLKGSERGAAQRAPLSAALVVDLRVAPDEASRRALWSLADAMAADLRSGDRFALVIAGAGEPVRLEAGGFDRDAVRRALAAALQQGEAAGSADGESLDAALQLAYATVRQQAPADAALGAKLVVLATAGRLGAAAAQLEAVAHEAALAGTSLTAVGVGGGSDGAELGRLAAVGQGRRRLVADAQSARGVLAAELAAAGRVVARAVRLQIKLRPGVELVGVLGSEPLDRPQADRVRQAEVATDATLAAERGIAADRGEDEEGIQIVIPAYYAGDAHVVLLDLVVTGPGPVADVRIRYKDLVRMTNGVATDTLALGAGADAPSPKTRLVARNRLGQAIAAALLAAADHAAAGRWAQAEATVRAAQARAEAVVAAAPALASDAGVLADRAMVTEYLALLADHPLWAGEPALAGYVARSLELAGRTKRR